MASASSVWPLHVAIASAITGDVTLMAMLASDGVYSLVAPRQAPLDYIVLGTTMARLFPTFERPGEDGSIQISLWCANDDQSKLLQMYGELRRVLHNVVLTLTGTTQVPCAGTLELVMTSPDPSGELVQAVCNYFFKTL